LVQINSTSANLVQKVGYRANDGGQTVDIASSVSLASSETSCFDARRFVAPQLMLPKSLGIAKNRFARSDCLGGNSR
jgi:hypothetical protein